MYNEKCCQGMPAEIHVETYVSKQDLPNFDKIWADGPKPLAWLAVGPESQEEAKW